MFKPGRALASAGGTTHYLVGETSEAEFLIPSQPAPKPRVDAPGPRTEQELIAGLIAAFVDSLPAHVQPVASDLVTRLSRLDEDLEIDGDRHGVSWFHRGEALCSLSWTGVELQAHLAGTGVPHVVKDEETVDILLDWVIALHLDRLEDEDADEQELAAFELTPASHEQILTPAEIEAFRQ